MASTVLFVSEVAQYIPLVGVFFFGAILASFAGVYTERVGTGQSWTKGRSKCNACNRLLRARDLFPILSLLFSKGRCRTCTAKIPFRYSFSEALTGSLFLLAYIDYGFSSTLAVFYVFAFFLTIIVLYDIRHTIVPFIVSLILVGTGAVYAFLVGGNAHDVSLVFLLSGCIGLGFFLLHTLSGGRWMGLGDTPVAIALSLLTGMQALSGLLFSFWIGAVIGIGILVMTPPGRRMGIEVPFVPFLALGYMLALFTQWNPLSLLL